MLCAWFVLLGCPKSGPEAAPDDAVADVSPLRDEAVRGVEAPLLRTLLAEHWDGTMRRFPQWANDLGDRRFEAEIFDPSPEARDRWLARQRDWMVRLSAMPDGALTPADDLTRELLQTELQSSLRAAVCQFDEWAVSARSNALVSANWLGQNPRLDTEGDARALLVRYQSLPGAIRQEIANLERGLAEGRVGVAASMRLVVDMLDEQLADPVEDWPMALPIADAPEFEGRAAWADDVRSVLDGGVREALTAYRDLLRDRLVPAGRAGDDVGLHALPDGEACYEARIEAHTTLPLTADELHDKGLAELESIHAEFRELGRVVFDTDDLAAIFRRLREDPELRFETAEQVLQTAEDALSRARAAIPEFFGRLPEAPCVVEPIPDYLAPHTTIAYYEGPRPDGSRPGTYYVNTYAPETRPRHEAEVLAFHESIPGHHLQIAIGQELDALPAFRRHAGFTAFVEGWALYTERLSDEMGLYSGDVDRLGMLSFDAWRAARLVVDTGIHAKGWSRERAERFMRENTPLAVNNIANEVDRYVNSPGQALAYKVGQLQIAALRDRARAQLGDGFSYRDFHDRVLGAGAVPLSVLIARIEDWLAGAAAN